MASKSVPVSLLVIYFSLIIKINRGSHLFLIFCLWIQRDHLFVSRGFGDNPVGEQNKTLISH